MDNSTDDTDMDMEVSYCQSAQSPPFVDNDVSMDVTESPETADDQSTPQPAPNPPVTECGDSIMACSRDNASESCIEMELGSMISEEPNNSDQIEKSVDLTSEATFSANEETMEMISEDQTQLVEADSVCSTPILHLGLEEPNVDISTKTEEDVEQSVEDHPSFYNSPKDESPQMFWDVADSQTPLPIHIDPPFSFVPTPLFSNSVRTPLKHTSFVEEFSIAGSKTSDLSIARDKSLTDRLLSNFDFLRSTSSHTFEQLKNQPPVVGFNFTYFPGFLIK